MSPFTLLEVSLRPCTSCARVAPWHARAQEVQGRKEPECSIKRRYAIHGG